MPWSHAIPREAERPCDRDEGCPGRYQLLGRPFFDADGSADVGLICRKCGLESVHFWNWKWSN